MLHWPAQYTVVVSVLAFPIGCVHLDHYTQFGIEDLPSVSHSDVAVVSSVHDTPKFNTVSLLLMVTETTNEPPFTVEIRVKDASGDCQQLVIKELVVNYADGTNTFAEGLPLTSRFEESSGENMAAVTVHKALSRRESATVTARGVCMTKQGVREPFQHSFKVVKNQKAGILPGFLVLNGI